MDNPTILYQATKLHYRDIRQEMASWRMANQVKITKPGVEPSKQTSHYPWAKLLRIRKTLLNQTA